MTQEQLATLEAWIIRAQESLKDVADDRAQTARIQLENVMSTLYQQPAIAPAWISVKDRLPEDGAWVAVYDPTHPELKTWPACWDATHECFVAGHWPSAGWFQKDEVTHWMALPAAPTGDQT